MTRADPVIYLSRQACFVCPKQSPTCMHANPHYLLGCLCEYGTTHWICHAACWFLWELMHQWLEATSFHGSFLALPLQAPIYRTNLPVQLFFINSCDLLFLTASLLIVLHKASSKFICTLLFLQEGKVIDIMNKHQGVHRHYYTPLCTKSCIC